MLTPLLCIIVMIVELRVDAWKLSHVCRRPYPNSGKSIGNWLGIIQALSFIGVLTNTAILVFTAETFDTSTEA